MKKILVGIDPYEININTIDFACYVAKLSHSKLIGVFLDNAPSNNSVQSTVVSVPFGPPIFKPEDPMVGERRSRMVDSTRQFENLCFSRGVGCSIHHDSGFALNELIKESRYADMLILDAELSFGNTPASVPSEFAKDVLSKTECPVIIAPYSFNEIQEIIFTFDDSPSSVYAIKQFTYLFPEYSEKKVILLQVGGKPHIGDVQNQRVQEFLKMHYSKVRHEILSGNEENELFRTLIRKKHSFVVMGAYGRKIFSLFFKHSTAEILLKTSNLPFFIAHP